MPPGSTPSRPRVSRRSAPPARSAESAWSWPSRILWARVDAPVREVIVDAWAAKRSFEAGGRRELGWVLDTQHGQPAILAAVLLVHAGGPGSGEAAGTLERATKDGPSSDRVLAIELAPLRLPALREAVRKAEADPDEAVAAASRPCRGASRRRRVRAAPAGRPPEREALIAKLLGSRRGTGAARSAARGGARPATGEGVVPILEHDGAAADQGRAEAGAALVDARRRRRARR